MLHKSMVAYSPFIASILTTENHSSTLTSFRTAYTMNEKVIMNNKTWYQTSLVLLVDSPANDKSTNFTSSCANLEQLGITK